MVIIDHNDELPFRQERSPVMPANASVAGATINQITAEQFHYDTGDDLESFLSLVYVVPN